jgi:hypothetical protein
MKKFGYTLIRFKKTGSIHFRMVKNLTELVVDHIVGSEAHPEERASGVEVGRHPRPGVHVLPDTPGVTHTL